jgi:hypothetical protein
MLSSTEHTGLALCASATAGDWRLLRILDVSAQLRPVAAGGYLRRHRPRANARHYPPATRVESASTPDRRHSIPIRRVRGPVWRASGSPSLALQSLPRPLSHPPQWVKSGGYGLRWYPCARSAETAISVLPRPVLSSYVRAQHPFACARRPVRRPWAGVRSRTQPRPPGLAPVHSRWCQRGTAGRAARGVHAPQTPSGTQDARWHARSTRSRAQHTPCPRRQRRRRRHAPASR